ncbi:MAG: hypothetical protein AMQ74_01353 [Candidatus Methanofastidiosum methylothiophilum]|uniref:Uncharacterized protein n=1 Tax=Candidatus Methanofastidiosum methylothiophilum TaxID=1705564 RepID=A0A150IYC1_9EURY|nr:MAG: hypothetical protein AMQ74_01353 [Candidatus Methanofastidiosum methylthiophilus]NMC76959.1 hypothetical protein [Candidatus Methanofastidiosa archaeon]
MKKSVQISLLIVISAILLFALPIGVFSEDYTSATNSAISYLEKIDPENPYLPLARDTLNTNPKMSINFALKGIIGSNKGNKGDNLNTALQIMSSLKLIPEDRMDMFNILSLEYNLTRSQKYIEDSAKNSNLRYIENSAEYLKNANDVIAEIRDNGKEENKLKLKKISETYLDRTSSYSNLYKDMANISFKENRYLATILFSIYAKNNDKIYEESLETILNRFDKEWDSFFGKDAYNDSPFSPDSLKELQNKAVKYREGGNEDFANVISEYVKFQAISYTEFINAIEEGGL